MTAHEFALWCLYAAVAQPARAIRGEPHEREQATLIVLYELSQIGAVRMKWPATSALLRSVS